MGRRAIAPGEHGDIQVKPAPAEAAGYVAEVAKLRAPTEVKEWLAANGDHVLRLGRKLTGRAADDASFIARTAYRSVKTGRPVDLRAEGITEAEARARLVARVEALRREDTGTGGLTGDSVLGQAFDALLKSFDDGNHRAQTVAGYRRVLERSVRQQLGHRALAAFTTADVNDFLRDTAAAGRFHDARVARTLLRATFDIAVDARAVAVNPVLGSISAPKDPEKRARRAQEGVTVLAPEVATAMRRALKAREDERTSGPRPDGQLRSIFELWLALAARPNEVLALRVKDVHIDDAGAPVAVTIAGTITSDEHGRRSRQPMGKTDSALRTLPLVPVAAKAVQRRLSSLVNSDPESLLFTQRDGVTPHDLGYLSRALNLIASRTGLDAVHAYLLRRTSATAIAASFGLEAAARALGHTDGDTSTVRKHYVAHAARQVPAEVMAAVGEKLLPDID